ncbi:MAG: cobyric acid synthase CobQ, partial [Methylococcaceae bacterium]|nr:cobyric acid synthase CobQ [Methylococcaceae bacterium]
GKLLGICGGYQMLGKKIHDPDGIEGKAGSSIGLSFLDLETTLKPHKCLRQVTGSLTLDNAAISGYEIHAGITSGADLKRPLVQLAENTDGAISADNLIAGTYLHGLFDLPSASNALLDWAGLHSTTAVDYKALREEGINLIADTLEQHFDFSALAQALESFEQNH